MYFIWYKNGLVGLPICVVEPKDYVLLPNPGYTDYLAGVLLARAKPYSLELAPEHQYLPQWDEIEPEILDKTKLIYLTYPNNPTGSVANTEFLMKRLLNLKIRKQILYMTLHTVLLDLIRRIQVFSNRKVLKKQL